MEAVKVRIAWVDIGKFICMMFVMLSHLESGTEALRAFYSPFFLTGFFFLSGYVYRQPESFRENLQKKTRGLFWPWLCLSVSSIGLSYLTPGVDLREIGRRLVYACLQIRTLGDEVWFVAALFAAYIPFYFFAKWEKRIWSLTAALALALLSILYTQVVPGEWFPWGFNCLPWHLEYVFQAMLWMLLGYDFKLYGEKIFDQYSGWFSRAALWGAYLLMVYGPFRGIAAEYIRSGLGVLSLVSLCKIVKSNAYFRFVGANTMTYFAFHGRAYALIERSLNRFAGEFYGACLENPIVSNLLAVVITVAVSLILVIPAEIINRWFPWMLGRKRA